MPAEYLIPRKHSRKILCRSIHFSQRYKKHEWVFFPNTVQWACYCYNVILYYHWTTIPTVHKNSSTKNICKYRQCINDVKTSYHNELTYHKTLCTFVLNQWPNQKCHWRYNTMTALYVNWELFHVHILTSQATQYTQRRLQLLKTAN